MKEHKGITEIVRELAHEHLRPKLLTCSVKLTGVILLVKRWTVHPSLFVTAD